jgi:hypothetical protein
MSLFGLMSVRQVVGGTKRARRGFTGWSLGQIGVPHSKVGGITSHHAGFHQSMDSLHVEKLPYVVGRDASTVLLAMEGTRRYR